MILPSLRLPFIIYAVLSALLMALCNTAAAKTAFKATDDNVKGELTLTSKRGQLTLDVKKMPLKSALETVAKKNHFPLHFSELPEALITTHCAAPNLQQVLECVLENKADLIIRYHQKGKENSAKPRIAEAWVVPSKLGDAGANPNQFVSQKGLQTGGITNGISQNNSSANADKSEQLLEQAQSSDPTQKATAIGALLVGGRKGDPLVKDALERALTDENPEVRAQALSSLSHREGDGALPAIEQGLQDTSEDVRIMAVDGIRDDIALLQQAVNDNDEVVRSLAEIKLQLLTQRD